MVVLNPLNRPGASGIAGQGRDLAVAGYFAARDAFDDGDYLGGESHVLYIINWRLLLTVTFV
jgi:hypothetical protein